jgi:hypothetical protein
MKARTISIDTLAQMKRLCEAISDIARPLNEALAQSDAGSEMRSDVLALLDFHQLTDARDRLDEMVELLEERAAAAVHPIGGRLADGQ